MAMIGRPLSSAMALPSPMVEPPPMATQQSASRFLAAALASRAVSIGTCITAPGKIPEAIKCAHPEDDPGGRLVVCKIQHVRQLFQMTAGLARIRRPGPTIWRQN